MRYRVIPGDIQRYRAAFHDDTCIECHQPIEEGDPIGFLLDPPTTANETQKPRRSDRHGPLCDDCIESLGTHTHIEVSKR